MNKMKIDIMVEYLILVDDKLKKLDIIHKNAQITYNEWLQNFKKYNTIKNIVENEIIKEGKNGKL